MTSPAEHRTSLLRPLVELTQGESGPYLRYDTVYDHIRLARTEDNPHLSQGVWIKEIKRADFALMEKLCLDALTSNTKDLQIFAWLLEAWIGLYGIPGVSQGIEILREFLETFWKTCHPLDMEHRSLLFQWLDDVLSMRLYTTPLTSTRDNARDYHFQDYCNAALLEQVSKRDATSKKMAEDAKKRGDISLEQFMQDLFQTDMNLLISMEKGLHRLVSTLKDIKKFLDTHLERDAPSFSKLGSVSVEMIRLLQDTITIQHQQAEKRRAQTQAVPYPLAPSMPLSDKATLLFPEEYTPNPDAVRLSQGQIQAPCDHSPPPMIEQETASIPPPTLLLPPTAMNRSEAYAQLRMLADVFAMIEPQSPITSLLSVISTWEKHSFQDILTDFMGKDAVSLFLTPIKKEG